ncbi:hypothetical protein BXZ70DRAFT_913431 [Cristinia sonorae]|uniref:F-box domain-containing protein n=1 Tax=Cristinia sonorae TaxID=1940300 RepID=A0A8K0UZS6_9AGAR|nr:hypothetical protein BXZ70DRAFT_913431 [Cristinia sonorae]
MSLISICAHTLAGILQCLPNIRDLSIQHAEVTRDNRKHEPEVGAPSTLATLHTQRGPFRLRSLDLQASFPTIFELYSLLDIFDHIDKLMFRGGNWAPQNRSGEYLLDRALPDYFPRPVVHNLVVTDGAISNAVLAMMRQSPSVATLHSIEGSIFIWSKGRILQLLEACTNLKVLDMELFVTADTRYLGSVQTVDFSCCLGITSMTVKLTGLPSPVERMELLSVRSTVSSLMSILSTITPSLRTLSIETSLGHLRDETQRLWFFGQLQSALKRFTALESFVLVVFSSLKPAIYDSQIIHVRVELDGPKPISVGGDEAVAIILQEMSDLYLGVPVRVVGRDC